MDIWINKRLIEKPVGIVIRIQFYICHHILRRIGVIYLMHFLLCFGNWDASIFPEPEVTIRHIGTVHTQLSVSYIKAIESLNE